LCRWFDSAPGHQEHVLRNANPHRLAFLFVEFVVLVSGPFPLTHNFAWRPDSPSTILDPRRANPILSSQLAVGRIPFAARGRTHLAWGRPGRLFFYRTRAIVPHVPPRLTRRHSAASAALALGDRSCRILPMHWRLKFFPCVGAGAGRPLYRRCISLGKNRCTTHRSGLFTGCPRRYAGAS
jgi:hypothetical protein